MALIILNYQKINNNKFNKSLKITLLIYLLDN
jgi:hypothetical protein